MAKKEDRQLAQTPTDGRFLATLTRKAKHSKELKEPLLCVLILAHSPSTIYFPRP